MNTQNIPAALEALAGLGFTADVEEWEDSCKAWLPDLSHGVAVTATMGVALLPASAHPSKPIGGLMRPEGHASKRWDSIEDALSELPSIINQ